MEPTKRTERRGRGTGVRRIGAVVAAVFALILTFVPPSFALPDGIEESAFEKHTAAEKASRFRYRRLEVASLVVIFSAGAGTAYWLIRRKKP